MKNVKNVKKAVKGVAGALGFVACAALTSPLASAADADSGWLVGLNIGQSSADIDDARITEQLNAVGLTVTSISDDDTDTAYKIFGGYKFNPNFALEGGYFNLGQFGYKATTNPAGTRGGNIKLQGLNVDAVGILPINEKFSAFARVGVNYAEAKDSFYTTGAVPALTDNSTDKSDINYKAGLGLQYDFTRMIGMRAELERYRINDAVGNDGDINMISLGLVVKFGDKAKPAPKPVAVAAAPVETQRYCSVLALTYEINADGIQRESKEKLAVLSTFMKKYPDTTAVIEGYSDNVGTSQKNMELSERRAQSVVNYLVNDQKIEASRLKAVGFGEKYPIADNNTDAGKRQNRRVKSVITCVTDFEGLKVATARTTVAMEIEFDAYKNNVLPKYRNELHKVANFMKANPSVTATVEGHADNVAGIGKQQTRPSAKVSMEVSRQRAESVVNYLVNQEGIEPSRLTTEAFGKNRRTAYGTTLASQQENRRVIIVFNYAK